MVRPTLGPSAMTHVVKFRMREDEYAELLRLSHGGPVSEVLRELVRAEHERRMQHVARAHMDEH
jgi:RNA polymerase-interacting CarD/CdnL/TRCF family regulator